MSGCSINVLVVNCGSSSIKFRLYEMPAKRELARGVVDRISESPSHVDLAVGSRHEEQTRDVADHHQGLELILDALARLGRGIPIDAVGHRVVHGGEHFSDSVLVDERVLADLDKLLHLAPLHHPPNLAGMRAAHHWLPDAAQVACFDTAFHAGMPEVAYLYALPYELYRKYGIRRYGFHGTSHRYVAQRTAALLDLRGDQLNAITCHLGNGSSLAAIRQGQSVDTSMGMTPLEGVPMGTRSGDFDPSILLLLAERGYDAAALERLCNRESGLLGLSGASQDMRQLAERARTGDERSQLAIDVFCYRVKKYIGAYLAVLGKVDALVFTGGIGENAPVVRQGICAGLAPLGFDLDPQRNQAAIGSEASLETEASASAILVVPTDEEGVIAQDTYKLVSSDRHATD